MNYTKIGFGLSSGVNQAIEDGKLDAYDLLLLDGATSPKVGWIDADGEVRIVPTGEADLSEIEAEVAKKIDNEEVEDSYEKIKYEVSDKPADTLVTYMEKEIRVMCPASHVWELRPSGETADVNSYYIGVKAYAPENAVSFKEDTKAVIEDETIFYFEGNDFAGIDAYGRKYSIIWLPVAKYDTESTTWTYYGAASSNDKYIGWFYSVEWYDADGAIITSDCIRINLANEDCYSVPKPYYVSDALKEAKEYTDAAVAVISGIQVVEF